MAIVKVKEAQIRAHRAKSQGLMSIRLKTHTHVIAPRQNHSQGACLTTIVEIDAISFQLHDNLDIMQEVAKYRET